jgi:hypothetical protein
MRTLQPHQVLPPYALCFLCSSSSHALFIDIFHLPYQLFVDSSREQDLYRTLGMSTLAHVPVSTRDKSEYAKAGSVRGMAMVWKNALRTGIPFWAKGGDTAQLGGEFVLGPGCVPLACSRSKFGR